MKNVFYFILKAIFVLKIFEFLPYVFGPVGKTAWLERSQQTFVGLEDVLKTSWRHVLKTSWKHVLETSWRHVLKMSWRHILKTSWRHYGDKQNTYWGYLYLTNLNVYLTNLYLTILRRIQNALSRTHHSNICLILELK